MATLESIRRRSGLLIVVIGFAMLAFILTDLLSSGNIFFQGDLDAVGKVNGEKIAINDFNAEIEQLRLADESYRNQSTIQLANAVWRNKLDEIIMGEKYDKLGFVVTSDELYDKIINNPNIVQMEAFLDPNTGRFDRGRFNSTLANLRDNANSTEEAREQWNAWLAFENDVRKQALTFKYNDAVQMGLYHPVALARHEHAYSAVTAEVNFVQVPYTSIPDEEVEVTDADYEAYYGEHKHEFRQDFETRDILFVNFPIEPSAADSLVVYQELEGLIEPDIRFNNQTGENDTIPGFRTTDDDSLFVSMNSSLPFRSEYTRQGMLSDNIDSLMFAAEPGFIYGPYEEAGGYKISKLVDVKMLPDSVKARHILIAYQGAQNAQVSRSGREASELSDSLLSVVREDPSKFSELASTYSDDPGSKASGGDLDWFKEGVMTRAFSNYAFYSEPGDIGLVATEFGFHIIEVLDQGGESKGVKVASVYREILPTRQTETDIYSRAAQFAAEAGREGFTEMAESMGLKAREMTDLQESLENVIGLGQARPVVTWAFGKDRPVAVDDISMVNNNNNAFVVVKLTGITEKGYKSLDRVREEIKPMVINRVKAARITADLEPAMAGGNIPAIASELGQNPALQRLNLGSSSITGVGSEPVVVGAMMGSPVGELTGPLSGNRGVYIYTVASVAPYSPKTSYAPEVSSAQSNMRDRVNSRLFQAYISASDIEDYRIRFF